ncbi:beta-ketoacyl synthase chain length factor [Komagataeibacter xylinus]|uniref:Beta-ketoacyl synthase chain length factor n=1 Tax=Komagataeibacter xylinus TaxID=28448 RepID=A0A857FM12_KOMXY|nr:beta-ketoacyl synthase chain length factor [Komagataeibacter xylinus]QHC35236.1 beta-ketoacyl synthase chain length factor [Komagataeibacter xylinus]
MRVWISGLAVLADGMAGWEPARAILRGEEPWQPTPCALPQPTTLPPNERRRTSPIVRLAMAVANQACAAAGCDPATVHNVFGSSNGDGMVVNAILQALADPAAGISPTQFHNCVHNAAAGYWTIGSHSHQPVACFGGYDWSWGFSLLQAAAEAVVEEKTVLLCVYDMTMPQPLGQKRATRGTFGVGLVLSPHPVPHAQAMLDIDYGPQSAADTPLSLPDTQTTTALRALCHDNPAARCLPLLAAMAEGGTHEICVAGDMGHVAIKVTPC